MTRFTQFKQTPIEIKWMQIKIKGKTQKTDSSLLHELPNRNMRRLYLKTDQSQLITFEKN